MRFEESKLLFDFSDLSWNYLMQYDQETDFDKIQNAILGTKAVDFIGIFKENTLCIIEVKNFRGTRIQNKPRVEDGDEPLDLEVQQVKILFWKMFMLVSSSLINKKEPLQSEVALFYNLSINA